MNTVELSLNTFTSLFMNCCLMLFLLLHVHVFVVFVFLSVTSKWLLLLYLLLFYQVIINVFISNIIEKEFDMVFWIFCLLSFLRDSYFLSMPCFVF